MLVTGLIFMALAASMVALASLFMVLYLIEKKKNSLDPDKIKTYNAGCGCSVTLAIPFLFIGIAILAAYIMRG